MLSTPQTPFPYLTLHLFRFTLNHFPPQALSFPPQSYPFVPTLSILFYLSPRLPSSPIPIPFAILSILFYHLLYPFTSLPQPLSISAHFRTPCNSSAIALKKHWVYPLRAILLQAKSNPFISPYHTLHFHRAQHTHSKDSPHRFYLRPKIVLFLFRYNTHLMLNKGANRQNKPQKMMHIKNKSVHFAQVQHNYLKITTVVCAFFCNFVTWE